MFRLRLQRHQIDDVDHANTQVGDLGAEDATAARASRVGTSPQHAMTTSGSPSSRGPFPDAGAGHAVGDGFIHAHPLRSGLFAGDDQVDIVAAAQAVVGNGEQAVGVGGQIDAHDVGLLVEQVIDEARVLVAEAVMILPPDSEVSR